MKFLLAQLNPIVGHVQHNKNKIVEALHEAKLRSADVVVTSELVLSGYPSQDLLFKPSYIETIEKAVSELQALTQELELSLLLGTPWRAEGHLYNTVLVFSHGHLIGSVFKHHLPNYGIFDDKRHFSPGPAGQPPIPLQDHNLGIMVCEDTWYPHSAQRLRDQGASLLISLNASPYEQGKWQQRLSCLEQRVQETDLPILYVNQVGGQDGIVFDGRSFVMNNQGHLAAVMPGWQEAMAPFNFPLVKFIPPSTLRFDPLEEDYFALVLGLRDYVEKNGFDKVVLGLSGGIDSAFVATLACEALGPEAVLGIMMPSQFTSKQSFMDAEFTAKALGIETITLPIDTLVSHFHQTLKATGGLSGSAAENIQSRIRGTLLMSYSNQHGHLVLNTGNKSEFATGYTTLYGDMVGAYAPIKDVYKTYIYDLAHWRNNLSPVFSESILTKAPTAELRPNQTDQDTLPPYDILDNILKMLIDDESSVEACVTAGYDKGDVLKVQQMIDRAEYKRHQAPPGTKITRRQFGYERRYPITNGWTQALL